MPGAQPGALKKPAQLRDVFLKYTTPAWTQPVSIYLLERVDGDKVWLACRPALDLEQETSPRFQLPGEEEFICFEHVEFSKLHTGDDTCLGHEGAMAEAIMFDHLIIKEESPHALANMLALCPDELRAVLQRSHHWCT